LTNLSVTCLLQDRSGYLWVGSDNGLFRYDGDRFLQFGYAEGLPGSEIRDLAESPAGELWVVTESGVVRLKGMNFEPVKTGERGRVNAIAIDRLGRVYLESVSGILRGVSDGAGVYQFHLLVEGATGGLFVDGENLLFTQKGDLWRLKAERAERIGSPAGLPAEPWASLVIDSVGSLWVRSLTRLYELPQGKTRFVDRSQGIPHNTPEGRMVADRHGKLYLSSDSGVVVLEGSHRIRLDSAHGLPADAIGPLLVDHEDLLWMGSYGGGLIRRLGHGEWLSWKKEDGLSHNTVWSIQDDSAGRLWVGTSGGLDILDSNGRVERVWTRRSGLAGDRVLAIAEASSGEFFAGTDPGGLSRFSKSGNLLRSYGVEQGLTLARVVALVFDRQQRLWAVGTNGCFRSRSALVTGGDPRFERMNIPGINAQTIFYHLVAGEDGSVWIGSSSGLIRFANGIWKVFTTRDGLESNEVAELAQGEGALWASYRDSFGITRVLAHADRLETAHIDRQDGLSSGLIFAIAFDRAGRLWATTDNGVDVREQGRWRHYRQENGLIWNDTSGHAVLVDRAGSLWVGTSNGLSRFTALPYPVPALQPQAVLTSIKTASLKFMPGDTPALAHEQNSLLIRFSSLCFSLTSQIRYRYRLRGAGDAWNETQEKSVRFVGLSAGKYVFEVIAAGPDGVWSRSPAQFAFSIEPPRWQSRWFLAIYLLLAMLLGGGAWQLRTRALVAQKRLLERQVAARTAELSESHRRLEELAFCDALTSIPNRRMFVEQYRMQMHFSSRRSESFALLLIDLDRFKQINDGFGHDAGDAVLVEVAARLRTAVRDSDFVARVGGDEFAILVVPAPNREGVEAVCQRVIHSFDTKISFLDTTLDAGCSIGIALYPEDGDTQKELYKSADLALYKAKRIHRNAYCWHGEKNNSLQ
jgi:diguanylate cyclase (GGDEF)-like protein